MIIIDLYNVKASHLTYVPYKKTIGKFVFKYVMVKLAQEIGKKWCQITAKRNRKDWRVKNQTEHVLKLMGCENTDKEDVEFATSECIISMLENVVTEWVSCESFCNWYHTKFPYYLTRHVDNWTNEMISIGSNSWFSFLK